ncbi:MAG: SlyX family protein [Treponema sp.]|nr:SlyX family protein [Treponema sp.]
MEERLTNLEIKLSYVEDFLNQLQEETVKQAKEIEKLKHDNKILTEKLKDVADNMQGDIPNRKPPHY